MVGAPKHWEEDRLKELGCRIKQRWLRERRVTSGRLSLGLMVERRGPHKGRTWACAGKEELPAGE